jgi:hypothetical protein
MFCYAVVLLDYWHNCALVCYSLITRYILLHLQSAMRDFYSILSIEIIIECNFTIGNYFALHFIIFTFLQFRVSNFMLNSN